MKQKPIGFRPGGSVLKPTIVYGSPVTGELYHFEVTNTLFEKQDILLAAYIDFNYRTKTETLFLSVIHSPCPIMILSSYKHTKSNERHFQNLSPNRTSSPKELISPTKHFRQKYGIKRFTSTKDGVLDFCFHLKKNGLPTGEPIFVKTTIQLYLTRLQQKEYLVIALDDKFPIQIKTKNAQMFHRYYD